MVITLALKRTRFGLAIRAVSSNSNGAALVGVNVARVYAMTFGVGSACVAVAGGLMSPFVSLTPSVGEQFTSWPSSSWCSVASAALRAPWSGAGDRAGADRGRAVPARDRFSDPGVRGLRAGPLLPPSGNVRSKAVTEMIERQVRPPTGERAAPEGPRQGACLPRSRGRDRGARGAAARHARPDAVDRRPDADLRDHGGRAGT